MGYFGLFQIDVNAKEFNIVEVFDVFSIIFFNISGIVLNHIMVCASPADPS